MSRMMHLFRKYQYMLLIVFGVLLMFVFVIGDAVNNLVGGGQGGRRTVEVVLTWKHGAVTGNDLYGQRARHNMALEFLGEVVQETVKRGGTPKGPGVFRNQFGGYNPGISIAENDQAIVQKMLLAAKAESLGVKVDNDAVKAFLRQLSDGELNDNDLGVIYNKTIAGRISQQQLMDQLQHELLAQQMLMMTRAGLFVVPPREAWDYHNRMRRRVQTEMVVLRVDDFKDKVSARPSDAEIIALYEAGKDRFPNPYSPEVGFKRRRKVAFEYVRADFGKLQEEEVAKIKDTITDEDIEQYYEENKDRYRLIDLPESTSESDPDKMDSEAEPQSNQNPSDAPKTDATPDAAAPEKPVDDPAKQETSSEDAAPEPPAEKQQSADKPADSGATPGPAAEAPSGVPPAPTNEDGSCGAETEQETPATEQPAETPESPPTPAAAGEAAATTASESEESSNEVPSATAETAPTDQPEVSPDSDTPREGPDASPAETPLTEEKPDEPKYKPLNEELRMEIRDEIATDRARQPARERLDKSFEEIKAAVNAYGRQVRRIEVAKSGKKPPPVDYEKLAAEHGFVAGKIDPTDVIGIEQYDLGKAYEMTFTSWPPQRVSFAQKAFLESIQPYRAERIESAELDVEFLYWKVDELAAFVPKLEEIRDEVIDAWKHRAAFEIAKAEAESLAKQAAVDKPLGESLSDHEGLEIIQPPPFSWMSTGTTPFGGAGAPTLSEIEGVSAAGNDFMKSVFSLKQGQVGVAIDQPENVIYVVRIAAEVPTEEVLRQEFLASGVTPEMSRIAFVEIEDLWQDWYNDLEQEMNVKWKQ